MGRVPIDTGWRPTPATAGARIPCHSISTTSTFLSQPSDTEGGVTDVTTATKVSIKPLEDRVVVQANEAETTTASGLVIPDTAKEKPQEGTVVAVGPGRIDDNGNRVPLDVNVGDVVIYSKYGGPTITNDGVTIAREIDLDDPYENLGAQLAKNVATKTNDVAGDGTTTATVLAQALVHEGLRNVAAGANPMALGRGMAAAVTAIHAALDAVAIPVDDRKAIAGVATISAQDAEVGELIGEAMERVGKDGVITVEESNTMSTELDVTEGVQFDKGYLSPYFVTDSESMEAVLEDALVLLVSGKVGALADLLPLLEKVLSTGGRPLLIVAEDVEGEALSTLVVNSIRKTIKVAAVKSPYFGDRRKAFMTDLAVVTGGQVVSEDVGLSLESVGLEVLGTARRVTVTKDTTTIVDGGGPSDAIADRVAQIRREIENTDSDWDREKLQERLAKLAGGIAVIRVGAATEVEMKERKHRIEDAIAATRAAVEEGVVPGGGS